MSNVAEKQPGFRRIGDEAVQAKTGKGWEEWLAILDAWGMREKGHTLAARHLQHDHGLSPWWAQAVTIRYEWERGLRTEVSRDQG
ncbi:MAG: hypothetical protein HW388_1531 [Dehalococcoidia bacterium]|nr:hypothetical protein [Dehalococcoidia bacterium]